MPKNGARYKVCMRCFVPAERKYHAIALEPGQSQSSPSPVHINPISKVQIGRNGLLSLLRDFVHTSFALYVHLILRTPLTCATSWCHHRKAQGARNAQASRSISPIATSYFVAYLSSLINKTRALSYISKVSETTAVAMRWQTFR